MFYLFTEDSEIRMFFVALELGEQLTLILLREKCTCQENDGPLIVAFYYYE